MSGQTLPAFLRLFIALAVPVTVREQIERAQAQLRRHVSPGGIRWTKPEQFHITLKFLGDVPTEQVAVLEKSVAEVCAGFTSLQLSAGGIGFFPSKRKPRVVWAGAWDGAERLRNLFQRLDEAMLPFAPAERPGKFTGHVTLGRFKPGRRVALEEFLKRAETLREQQFGSWTAEQVEIVRCDLTANGAIHTPVATCPLKG